MVRLEKLKCVKTRRPTSSQSSSNSSNKMLLQSTHIRVTHASSMFPNSRKKVREVAITSIVMHLLKVLGGFCGYRNIQMMASYIIGAQSQGFEHFRGKLPSIFEIQDYIESAWDLGINSQGRIETGGIRGTRKYIGTPDVSPSLIPSFIALVKMSWPSV